MNTLCSRHLRSTPLAVLLALVCVAAQAPSATPHSAETNAAAKGAGPVATAIGAAPTATTDDTNGPPTRELLLELASTPRLAGTSGSAWGARFVARELEQAGFEVEIDRREVLLSLPRRIEFAIHADAQAKTALSERIERFDPDARPAGDVPKCNAWSASGSVRARVVDAGYGLRTDFERLKARNVDVRGAIALVRYGKCYRGIKVDLATEYGCSGVLLFSDPTGDGGSQGAAWPAGPWKPDWEAQRGSISPMGRTPGDPTTPGWASPHPGDASVKRLAGAELDATLPRIPCIPIGARDAAAIIALLAPVSSTDEHGVAKSEALGPGPVEVRLLVDQPRDLRVIENVIARLRGTNADTVIAGGHRDSWVRGANDNGAGTVALLRAAQLLGARAQAGWKPKNTITIGLWDGEEFGLIGSTEWGEANADWLALHTLCYINADACISGTRMDGASGTPGMLGVLRSVLGRTPAIARHEGTTPANLWDEWKSGLKEGEPHLGLPGSGSDFAVFAHHLNLPVLEFGFGGGRGGQYHTTFDDFEQVEKYLDPGFVGHERYAATLAELLSTIAEQGNATFDLAEAAHELARIANAEAAKRTKVPEPQPVAATAAASAPIAANAVNSPAASDAAANSPVGADAATKSPVAADGTTNSPVAAHDAANSPVVADGAAKPADATPAPAASPLAARLASLAQALEQFASNVAPGADARAFYAAFARKEGIERRPWYRNVLWSPGLEDGYGSEAFPTLITADAAGVDALEHEYQRLLAVLQALSAPAEHGSAR